VRKAWFNIDFEVGDLSAWQQIKQKLIG